MSAIAASRRIRTEAGTSTDRRVDRGTLAMAALLIIAPVLRAVAIVAHPYDTADAATTLALIDQMAGRWAVVHLVEPIAWVLLGLSGFVLLRLTPDKGRRLATAGALLFAIGAVGTAMLVYGHGEAYLFMTDSTVAAADMHDLYAVYHDGVPLAAPLAPLHLLGAFLLAAGLFRSGRVPAVAAFVLAVSVVVPNAIGSETSSMLVAGILGSAPIVAAMAVFAVALVRQSRTDAALAAT